MVVLLHPVEELRDMAPHVCVAPCLLNEPSQCALDRTMLSGCGSLILTGALSETVRTCPHLAFAQRHTKIADTAFGAAPSRNAVAILHCAFCGSSVGDLCMAVQHVPVLGPPHLPCLPAVLAFHRAVSRPAQPPQPTGSSIAASANAMSRAKACWRDPVCRLYKEWGQQSLPLACPPPTGLPRTICWPHSQSPLWHAHRRRPPIRADPFCSQSSCNLRVHLAHLFVQFFAYVRHWCFV